MQRIEPGFMLETQSRGGRYPLRFQEDLSELGLVLHAPLRLPRLFERIDAVDDRAKSRFLNRFQDIEELFATPKRGAKDGKDRKSTRLNSSHIQKSRMPSSA